MAIRKLTQDMLDDMVAEEVGVDRIGKEAKLGKLAVKDKLMELARADKTKLTQAR